MSTGALILWIAEWWVYAGLAVAIVFLAFGIERVEENARGAYIFRPLLVPGLVLLWPLVIARWITVERQGYDNIRRDRPLRDPHRAVWLILVVAIPAVLLTALLVRQSPPAAGDAGAVRLEAPTEPPRSIP